MFLTAVTGAQIQNAKMPSGEAEIRHQMPELDTLKGVTSILFPSSEVPLSEKNRMTHFHATKTNIAGRALSRLLSSLILAEEAS